MDVDAIHEDRSRNNADLEPELRTYAVGRRVRSEAAPPITVAIVGLGYWGPNLLRNAWEIEGIVVGAVCDRDANALRRQARRYPSASVAQSLDQVLDDSAIDAVIIATPVATHFEIARRCLLAGKHVLIEKPMAATSAEGEELIRIARDCGLVLMPGHTFLYSPPVVAVKEMLESEELGSLHYLTSSRVNLGIHRGDVGVVRDLAPHDFSILLYWLGPPTFLRAVGRASIVPDTLDVVFIDVGYGAGTLVHLELSWLAPTKLRRTVLVGSRKMVVYEDTSTEQLRVYDRGVQAIEPQSFGEFHLSYRSGDVLVPRLDPAEPLRIELLDFVDSIRTGSSPRSDAALGLQVVRLLEATERSLEHNGAPVQLNGPGRRVTPDRRRSVAGMPVVSGTFSQKLAS